MTYPGGMTFTNCGRGPPGYIMNCPGDPGIMTGGPYMPCCGMYMPCGIWTGAPPCIGIGMGAMPGPGGWAPLPVRSMWGGGAPGRCIPGGSPIGGSPCPLPMRWCRPPGIIAPGGNASPEPEELLREWLPRGGGAGPRLRGLPLL